MATLDDLRKAVQRGERSVELIVDYVVTLGVVPISSSASGPSAIQIFAQLAKVVEHLSILNQIQAQVQMKTSKLKAQLALEKARYKVEYDKALLTHPDVRTAPSQEARALVARGLCAPTAEVVAQAEADFAVYTGLNEVVSTTHQNLVTMKEALSKQVTILELELAASTGHRSGIR